MTQAAAPLCIDAALKYGREVLAKAGVASAALDARVLLGAATGLSAEHLILRGDAALDAEAGATFRRFVDARACGKPVSRIVGYREFWGLSLRVTSDTLDPRPDTETLVNAVVARTGHETRPYIRDLGTGSGAILLALLTALPAARGLGSDLSFGAVTTARANAQAVGLSDRASFLMSDWGLVPARLADIVVSNPPYIARGELPGLMREVRAHDPVRAVDGGSDGLEPYRRIAGQVPLIARPGALLAFEIGPAQARDVTAILAAAGASVRGRGLGVVRDLAGRPRVVVARAGR